MKDILALIFDFTLFIILWIGFDVNWLVAIVFSTSIVLAGWYLMEWVLWKRPNGMFNKK